MKNNNVSADIINQAEQFKKFLSYDGKNERLLEDCILFTVKHELWADANDFIEHAINNNIITAVVSAQKGFLCIIKGEFHDSVTWLKKAIELGLNDQSVSFNLAYANFMTGDIDNTLTIIQTYEIDNFDGAKILKARCYHHQGRLVEAKDLLSLVTSPDRETEAKSVLSLVLYDLNELDAAYELSCSLLSQNQSMEAMLAKASVELEKQDYETSEESFSDFCKAYPTVGRGWSQLSSLQFRNFDFDKALPSVKLALKHMPNHIGTWHILAWIHIMQGDVDSGLAAFESSYKIDRSFGETHGGIASAQALKGNTELAEKHIKLAKRLDPNSQSLIFAKMVLLNNEGKKDAADKLYSDTVNTVNPLMNQAPIELIKERLEYLSIKNKEKGILH